MCADKKVVYLQTGSLYFIKLPNVKKNVTLFSLLWNPEIMEWGKKKSCFCWIFDAGTKFLLTFFFPMYLCIKKSVCLLWN